jgi:hypothetical protein
MQHTTELGGTAADDAIVIRPGGKMIYRVSFACPTASLTHSVTDYITPSNSGGSRTQLDVTSEPVNDKGGYTSMEWSLRKS